MAGSPPSQVESLSLPILGRVAAGLPIEAFLHDEHIDVPATMVRNPSKTFALIVQGQSMIEDGILDGDVIFVQKQTYANNGETVVAMVNNQATVKRFYLHHKSNGDIHSNPQTHTHPPAKTQQVELRPANSTMQSMWYPPYNVDVQGVVVGLMRRF
jgi:repressor LexA